MKKIWGWIFGIVTVLIVAFYFVFGGSNSLPEPVAAGTNSNTGGNGNPSTAAGDGRTGSGNMNTGGMTMTGFKDGSYTGPVTDAIYGQVQVAVAISGGKITGVSWPVYPNGSGHTNEVNAIALPRLQQETLAAQSANINIVSGATQTSIAFQQSLAATLAQAKS